VHVDRHVGRTRFIMSTASTADTSAPAGGGSISRVAGGASVAAVVSIGDPVPLSVLGSPQLDTTSTPAIRNCHDLIEIQRSASADGSRLPASTPTGSCPIRRSYGAAPLGNVQTRDGLSPEQYGTAHLAWALSVAIWRSSPAS
jgi:hypothetical protein